MQYGYLILLLQNFSRRICLLFNLLILGYLLTELINDSLCQLSQNVFVVVSKVFFLKLYDTLRHCVPL
ncbi:MAG: hypothetical protein AVDCRST_MAG96-2495 [uncultured Segetibacter sp.]|uniref:Uncharacterized protein n=1 Tax=uncultured Segetibacter sp. TaxID=481133 RepID=A0A6J4T2U5_9BACT|nr:MAG: hypothetical protein AVDCRST_MAG96-2495 [uncultured Segetibacter sp.]